ncbi:hypothetical protein [Streptomyces sp. NRRL S-37]|uniref:hypothetical protein n=1 Tax=Streptomyces sp. NRRL S-37 TaxID=1463903 RepID=UPI000A5323E1|nr:hypothetical protein [Streptomyces sp. NRRL S-37]
MLGERVAGRGQQGVVVAGGVLSGYTQGFALLAVLCLAAAGAALLVPARRATRPASPSVQPAIPEPKPGAPAVRG